MNLGNSLMIDNRGCYEKYVVDCLTTLETKSMIVNNYFKIHPEEKKILNYCFNH